MKKSKKKRKIVPFKYFVKISFEIEITLWCSSNENSILSNIFVCFWFRSAGWEWNFSRFFYPPFFFTWYPSLINKSKILTKLKLKKKNYLLFSFHREENVDNHKKLKEIISTIIMLSKTLKMKCIVSTHPRTRLQLNKIKSKTYELIFLPWFP